VSEPKHLLIVFHSRSGGTQALADAAIAGATSDDIDGVDVRVKRAFDADARMSVGATRSSSGRRRTSAT
jgi:hypothetical protein